MLALSILVGWLAGPLRDGAAASAATLAAVAGFLAQAAWLEWRAGRSP